MNIFWSWQSDTPGKTGRFFIRNALQEAITTINISDELNEPTIRDTRDGIYLDQDIKNVPGSPDLAATIFEKIDRSTVVVADVTSAYAFSDGKKPINSNVAIELGYALRSRGSSNVIIVFNLAYMTHNELPFDLRHKGGIVTFQLDPSADTKTMKSENGVLVARFVDKLRHYQIENKIRSETINKGVSTGYSNSVYFSQGTAIARYGEPDIDEIEYTYTTEKLCYVRMMPYHRLNQPLSQVDLVRYSKSSSMIHTREPSFFDRNYYGAIAFEPKSPGDDRLMASTQFFPNGEIWAIASWLVISDRNDRPNWVKLPFVPILEFEKAFYEFVHKTRRLMINKMQVTPPIVLEMGITGTERLHLSVSKTEQYGPIRNNIVQYRENLVDGSDEEVDQCLLAFFEKAFDATGHPRPLNLNGFPEGAPR